MCILAFCWIHLIPVYVIFMGHVKGNFIITLINIHVLHAYEGNIKIYSPKNNHISQRLRSREIYIFYKSHIFRTCVPLALFYTDQHMILQYTPINNSCLTTTS